MTTIDDLFPEKGKLILSGSGRDFIEKLGVETDKTANPRYSVRGEHTHSN